MPAKPKSPDRHPGKNALEWTVFAASALLILAMFAVLALEAMQWEERPPSLAVTLGTPETKEGRRIIPVEVANHGDVAATDIRIELAGDDGQRAQVLMDFIARHGTRRGRVSFPAGGGSGQVRVVGIGFAEP